MRNKKIKYGIILFISVLLTILLSLLFIPKRDPKQTNINYNNNEYKLSTQAPYNPLIPEVNYSNARVLPWENEELLLMYGYFYDSINDYGLSPSLQALVEYSLYGPGGFTGFRIDFSEPLRIAITTSQTNDVIEYVSSKKVKRIEYDPESGISNNGIILTFEDNDFDILYNYQWGFFNIVLTDTITQQILNDYYERGFRDGKDIGYDKGLADGISQNQENLGFKGLLFTAFDGLGSILSIELLPNISIGAIILVPIVFGLVLFILGKKGD